MLESGLHAVAKVTSLSLAGFKGVPVQCLLDLDADVVLLTGPNGYGKTSVIEALEVIFTGDWVDRRTPQDPKPRRGSHRRCPLVHNRAQEAVLEARYVSALGESASATARVGTDGDVASDFRDASSQRRASLNWDLERDSSFFYQDGSNALIRLPHMAQAAVVNSLVQEPELFSALRNYMPHVEDAARTRIRTLASGRDPEEIAPDCAHAAMRFQEVVPQCVNGFSPKFARSNDTLYADATVQKALNELRERLALNDRDPRASGREAWPVLLQAFTEHAQRQIGGAATFLEQPPSAEEAPDTLMRLRPPAVSPEALWQRLAALRSLREAEEQILCHTETVQHAERGLQLLAGALKDADGAGREVGAIPLLESVLLLSRNALVLDELLADHHQLGDAVATIVGVVDRNTVGAALAQATELQEHLATDVLDHRAEIARLQADAEERRRLEAVQLHYAEIDRWLAQAHRTSLAEFAMPDDATHLDVDRLHALVAGRTGTTEPEGVRAWREFAERAHDWAAKELELLEAEAELGGGELSLARAAHELATYVSSNGFAADASVVSLKYAGIVAAASQRCCRR